MKTEYTAKSEYRGYTEVVPYLNTVLTTTSGELINTICGYRIFRVTATETPTNKTIVYYDVVKHGVIIGRTLNERDAEFIARMQ